MVLTGGSLEELFAKIAAYRRRHKMEPGNPEKEFTDRFCEDNPAYCFGAPKGTAKREAPRLGLNTRILNWVERMVSLAKKFRRVDKAEAKRRADICAGCPKQKEWESQCTTCAVSVRQIRRSLVGRLMAKFSEPTRLRGCDVLGEDPQISVWMDIPPVKNPDLPKGCWRRKEVKD